MGFVKRKLAEGASVLYRFFIWPFIRAGKELSTRSIMRQRSYIPGTRLEGRNLVGKNSVLKNCVMGFGSYVQQGCDITDADIGRYTSIGSDVKTVIGSHPTKKLVALHPAFNVSDEITGFTYVKESRFKDMPEKRTRIGSDVWLGNDVRIMGGVEIGDGAVVGTGALVTKDVPPYSINVGVPARIVKYRFTEDQIEGLLVSKWWDRDEEWIRSNIDRFGGVEEFLK